MSQWVPVCDPATGRTYYLNQQTQETSWTPPPPSDPSYPGQGYPPPGQAYPGQAYPGQGYPPPGQAYPGYAPPPGGQAYPGYAPPPGAQGYPGYAPPPGAQGYPGYAPPPGGQAYPSAPSQPQFTPAKSLPQCTPAEPDRAVSSRSSATEASILSIELSPFAVSYTGDVTWQYSPADAIKELGKINNRKNDIYPQGRDNCMKFLRECQAKGLSFQVKAKKTTPYWTWYFEIKDSVVSPLSPHLSAFAMHYSADDTWQCGPADAIKEIGHMNDRKNDLYPQGRDNCMQFLRECQAKGLSFNVKAKKTSPYWTWYFELESSGLSGRGANVSPLSPHLSAFTQHYSADDTWQCGPADAIKEIGHMNDRKNDLYPQGRDNCMQFLRECQAKGLSFKVKAKKTSPYWTWYFEL